MRKINTRSFVRATRTTTRDINRRILLNLVREHQPISRADLARRMRVGRGMVTSLVGELLSDGSIYEGTTVDAPRGRRPMMLYVRTHDRLVVAIDVRFSRTYLMLTDFNGNPIAMETFETVVDPDELVAKLARRILGSSRPTRRPESATGSDWSSRAWWTDQRACAERSAARLARRRRPRCAGRGDRVRRAHRERADRLRARAHVARQTRRRCAPRLRVRHRGGRRRRRRRRQRRGRTRSQQHGGRVRARADRSGGTDVSVRRAAAASKPTRRTSRRCRATWAASFRHRGARSCSTTQGSRSSTSSRAPGTASARAIAAIEETARHLGGGLAVIINTLNPRRSSSAARSRRLWDQVRAGHALARSERER